MPCFYAHEGESVEAEGFTKSKSKLSRRTSESSVEFEKDGLSLLFTVRFIRLDSS
jgi:hypothetical protein